MGPSRGGIVVGLLCAVAIEAVVGCAEGPRPGGLPQAPLQSARLTLGVVSGVAPGLPSVTARHRISPGVLIAADRSNESDQAAPSDAFPDEPYDPFSTEEETVEEYDPWEPFNTVMFELNRKIDEWALKPVAKAYNFVLPDVVQRGVENFFYNLRTPPRFFNNLFQGKVRAAGTEFGRLMLNTTFGLGGFFDVAKYMQIETPDEDFGQTLGYYGVPPGPYLVVPLFPPFTLRDATGYVVDLALNPLNWVVFPIIEVENVPSLVSHPNRLTTTIVQLTSRSVYLINERALNLESYEGVEEATVDLYSAVRNAYLQKRAKVVRE